MYSYSLSLRTNWKTSVAIWSLFIDFVEGLNVNPSSSTNCSTEVSALLEKLYTIEFVPLGHAFSLPAAVVVESVLLCGSGMTGGDGILVLVAGVDSAEYLLWVWIGE